MSEQRVEFELGDHAGYYIVDKRVTAPRPEPRVSIIMVMAPPGTLALKEKQPEKRIATQVAWQRTWAPALIKQVAENILEAAKAKDEAQHYSVEFAGMVRGGEIIVQYSDKQIRLSEQFGSEGFGIDIKLPAKQMKKLAEAIIAVADSEMP